MYPVERPTSGRHLVELTRSGLWRGVSRLGVVGWLVAQSIFISCRDDPQPQSQAGKDPIPSATPALTVVEGAARWNTQSGQSVDSLMAEYPIVLIGRVEGLSYGHEPLLPRSANPDQIPTIEGKPPLSAAPAPTFAYTLYKLRVEQARTGNEVMPGEIAVVYQAGGEARSADGVVVRSSLEGYAPLQEGERYLLFLTPTPGRPGELVAAPWGMYRLSDKVEPVNAQWHSLAVVQDLTSRVPADIPALVDTITR